jgi:chemotaxis protein MotB
MKRRGESEGKAGAPEWMVTYSDVISLLVTFFVMLLTFSTQDKEKFDKAKGSLQGALGIGLEEVGRLPQAGMLQERIGPGGRASDRGMDFAPETEALEKTVLDMNFRLKREKLGLAMTMTMMRRGVRLRIPAGLIFHSNTALLKLRGEEYMSKIAASIKVLSNNVEIVSHVERGPAISRGEAAWRLTHEQSAGIAEFLHKRLGIKAKRLSVGGMGDSRPLRRKPTPRDSRVEITLLYKTGRGAAY